MLNLHVHWGTPEAGVNDLRFDDDSVGDPNSRVYEIREVLDKMNSDFSGTSCRWKRSLFHWSSQLWKFPYRQL